MTHPLIPMVARRSLPQLVSALALLAAGCSQKRPATVALVEHAASRAAAHPVKLAVAQVAHSVFSADESLRDPFYPKSKRKPLASHVQTVISLDVPRLLQAGFQGIISSGDHRIALINNVMLEPGRQETISLRSGGQEQKVTVTCRDVTPTAVVLGIQGYPQPLTITRALIP